MITPNFFFVNHHLLSRSDNQNAFQVAGIKFSGSKAYHEMLKGKPFVVSGNELGNEKQNKKFKILIAEDDPTSEFLLKTMVKTFCTEMMIVKNGVDAVAACRVNQDIDLILMDIKMSFMDGHEATRQIRMFNKSVIIIAQTAHALIGDREKAIEAGCDDYIAKPIVYKELKDRIHRYFEWAF